MQPYFCPYLGYFQLINAVDAFVVYDNIEYTKRGWINRNRILSNGEDHMFSIPLRKGSDFLKVNERFIANDATKEINKIIGQIRASYGKAPHFRNVFPLIESIFLNGERNLFDHILNSIQLLKDYLCIDTPLFISSSINIDHTLKGKFKVIEICKIMNADEYVNPIGGLELYDKREFEENGIILKFHCMNDIFYKQGSNPFIKALSIIDILMFNSMNEIKNMLGEYTMI